MSPVGKQPSRGQRELGEGKRSLQGDMKQKGLEIATSSADCTLKGLLSVVLGAGSVWLRLWSPVSVHTPRTLMTPTFRPLQITGRDQPILGSSALSLIP